MSKPIESLDELDTILRQVHAGGFQDAVAEDLPHSNDEEMGMVPLPIGKAKALLTAYITEREQEAYKKGYIDGGIAEMTR